MPATRLTWLPPRAASLVALARRPALDTWTQVRADPGCVLLLARHAPSTLSSASPFLSLLRDAAVLDEAARLLGGAAVNWDEPPARKVYEVSLTFAETASRLARQSNRVDPDTAWAAGLTAPLGWLAMCAVDGEKVTACLADAAFTNDPSVVQRRLWGFDQAGIARRWRGAGGCRRGSRRWSGTWLCRWRRRVRWAPIQTCSWWCNSRCNWCSGSRSASACSPARASPTLSQHWGCHPSTWKPGNNPRGTGLQPVLDRLKTCPTGRTPTRSLPSC